MISSLQAAYRFVRANTWTDVFRAALSRDSHPMLQFIKYGFCGVAATIVHTLVVAVLSATIFPAGKGMMIDGHPLPEDIRAGHLVLNNALAFPFGALTAYLLNVAFVFTPGRHHKVIEAVLFFVIGAIGFFPGAFVVNWLAGHWHLPSTVAQLGFVITSVLVNFLCRKFIIFNG